MTTELNTAPTWVRFQLTLLFTDLTDSTKLGRMMEPEHYAEILTSIRSIWHAAAAKHHGQIVRSQGDGALISFGFPTSTEEDGRRAAEVALEIHNEVAQLRHSYLPGAFVPHVKCATGPHEIGIVCFHISSRLVFIGRNRLISSPILMMHPTCNLATMN